MQCYNCDETTDLKEWKFPERIVACKACAEYFRKCMVCMSYDVDLNVTGYEIVSDDKILCEKVVCEACIRDGNLPKDYYNKNKLSENQIATKIENKLKQQTKKQRKRN